MKALPLAIPDVLLLEPRVFEDNRGYFFESFNHKIFEELVGKPVTFVQDNQSYSKKNVLRGMHYQVEKPQGKLVRVLSGEIFDVVVDVRKNSPHFGQWVGAKLTSDNRHQLWVPPGFAHGFVCLSDHAEILYKISEYWFAEHERCIAWDDAELAIEWPIQAQPILKINDAQGLQFNQAEYM